MKKPIAVFSFLALAIMLLSFEDGINSNGAPIGSTGAPTEHTCAKSTCHATYGVNSGSGELLLLPGDAANGYLPGHTYHLTVSLTQNNIERFGFQLLALKAGDNTQAGTLLVVDSARTQIFAGTNEFSGRNYATYKYAGTGPYATGLGQWSLDWVAPEETAGDVTFYYAAVAANNDGTDYGDLVYTRQTTISATTATTIGQPEKSTALQVFPNPVSAQLNVNYEAKAGATQISLTDLLSRQSFPLLKKDDNPGSQSVQLNLTDRFAPGIYLLTISNGGQSQTQKIVIQ